MSNRTLRINELVQREINELLHTRWQSEAVAITITAVQVAPDLRDGRVFVSVVGSDEEAGAKLRWLRGKAGEIRREVGRRIVLKYLPRFEYLPDRSAVRGARILTLLDQLEHPSNEEKPPA